MIKMYDFKKQYKSIKKEIDTSIHNVLNDSAFSNGKYVEEFEKNFSKYIGSKYCVAVNNGTSALHAALMALDINKGDEVLVPSFSFFATCESVSLTGAKPVFVDSNYETFNIDINDIKSKITKKTRAIICVHLYGYPCDMYKLKQIANKYNLFLIEDAAQAHGAEFYKQKIGTFGDLSCFSFYPTKNLGSYGEGGAVLTSDDKLNEKLQLIRNHGSCKQYHHDIIGHNFRMTGFQGAILSVKLKYLDKWNDKRIKNACTYNEILKYNDDIKTPITDINNKHVFHQYVIKVNKRDKLKEYLYVHGIESAIYYPIPCHEQIPYKNRKLSVPNSQKLSNEVLALPISEHITYDNIEFISNTISNFDN